MQQFPVLRLLERHGHWIAIFIALPLPVLGMWLSFTQASWVWMVVLSGCGVVTYGFVKSYVELVRLMTDMLLPK
jgi:uncharacterized membrane protein